MVPAIQRDFTKSMGQGVVNVDKLKVGIVGYGGMGCWNHQEINTTEVLQVTSCYDIDPKRAKFAASKGLTVFKTLGELLACDDIDIVFISTPNNFHKEIAIKALKAGKHVICEKPAALNATELEEMIKVAEEKKRVFTVHQNRRWDKDFCMVKQALEKREIGKPFYIESRVQGSRGIPGDWRCTKVAGGGMLYDWGVHLIDQLMWLVDSPVIEVYAQLFSVKFPEVDDNFKLLLKFKNGIGALVQVDTYTFINLPRWYVAGDEGTLVINDWDCNGKIIKTNMVEFKWENGIVYTSAGPTRTMAPRPVETTEELPLPVVSPDARDFYVNFKNAIMKKEPLIVQPQQALRVLKVIGAAFDSSNKGVCIRGEF